MRAMQKLCFCWVKAMELGDKSNEIVSEKQCFFCEKNKGLKEKKNLVVMIGLSPCHERDSLKPCY